MSILINMDMPTRQILAVINPNGLVEVLAGNTLVAEYEAVPVPPHGRLIDADALEKNAYPFPCAIGTEWAVTLRQINDAPTIIQADKDGAE